MRIVIGQHRFPLRLGYARASSAPTPINSTQPCFIYGHGISTSSQSCYVGGYESVSDNQDSYIAGYDSLSATQTAFIQGIAVISSSQNCYINGNGISTSNVGSYIAGLDTATTSVSAYIRGHQTIDTSDSNYMLLLALTNSGANSKPLYIEGGVSLITDSQDCFISGPNIITAGPQNCYIHCAGVAEAADIVPTNLTSYWTGSGNTTHTTASITPPSNVPILVSIYNNDTHFPSIIPSLSGCGLTWTQLATEVTSGGFFGQSRMTLFYANGPATTGTLTATFSSSVVASIIVDQFHGAGSVVQTVGNNSGNTNVTGLTVTLASFSGTRNATYGAFTCDRGGTFVYGDGVGVGFTQLGNTLFCISEYKHTPDTTVDVVNTGGAQITVGIAAELSLANSNPQVCYIDGLETTTVHENAYIQSYLGTSADAQDCFIWGNQPAEARNVNAVNLTGSNSSATSTTYNTASITPVSNVLTLVSVWSIGSGAAPTISGCGLTWEQVTPQMAWTQFSSNHRMTLFRAAGTATSGAITATFPASQSNCQIIVDQFYGVNTNANGAGGIVQYATNNSGSSNAASLTVTLAAFASSTNLTYGIFYPSYEDNGVSPPNPPPIAGVGSGFTLVGHGNTLLSEWKNSADTTVDATTLFGSTMGGMALEIAKSTIGNAQYCCITAVVVGSQGCTIVASKWTETVKPCYISVLSSSTVSQNCYLVASDITYRIQNFDTVLYDDAADDTYLKGNILWPFTREARGLLPFGVLDNSVIYYYYDDLGTVSEGDPQYFTVPDGVSDIFVECWGAEGTTFSSANGGRGGYIKAKVPVEPGEIIQVNVGGLGFSSTGGFNGGGNGGAGYTAPGPPGGGGTDIRRLNNLNTYTIYDRLVVAGGGGGGATTSGGPANLAGQDGGDGGYPTGGLAYSGFNGPPFNSPYPTIHGGEGGTQSNGGAKGPNNGFTGSGQSGFAGELWKGGNAGDVSPSFVLGKGGAGGGGGFYGGGGAWSDDFSVAGGGGGGSSGITKNDGEGVILLDYANGVWTGAGKCKISWAFPTIVVRRKADTHQACFIASTSYDYTFKRFGYAPDTPIVSGADNFDLADRPAIDTDGLLYVYLPPAYPAAKGALWRFQWPYCALTDPHDELWTWTSVDPITYSPDTYTRPCTSGGILYSIFNKQQPGGALIQGQTYIVKQTLPANPVVLYTPTTGHQIYSMCISGSRLYFIEDTPGSNIALKSIALTGGSVTTHVTKSPAIYPGWTMDMNLDTTPDGVIWGAWQHYPVSFAAYDSVLFRFNPSGSVYTESTLTTHTNSGMFLPRRNNTISWVDEDGVGHRVNSSMTITVDTALDIGPLGVSYATNAHDVNFNIMQFVYEQDWPDTLQIWSSLLTIDSSPPSNLQSARDCFLNGQSANASGSLGCFIQGATEAFQPSYIEGRDPLIYDAQLPCFITVDVVTPIESGSDCFIYGLQPVDEAINCFIRVAEYTISYNMAYITVVSASSAEDFQNCYIRTNSSMAQSKSAFIFGVVKPSIDPKPCYIKA